MRSRWGSLWCPRNEEDWDLICGLVDVYMRPIDIDRFVECAEAGINTQDAGPDDYQSKWREALYGAWSFQDV